MSTLELFTGDARRSKKDGPEESESAAPDLAQKLEVVRETEGSARRTLESLRKCNGFHVHAGGVVTIGYMKPSQWRLVSGKPSSPSAIYERITEEEER